MDSKIILHFPNTSASIPDNSGYVVSDDSLKKEALLSTDLHIDDIFSFGGGIPVKANSNRIFCDVERLVDDEQEMMSQVGMGTIYTNSDDGIELRKVSSDLKAEILGDYYPHHQRLMDIVEEHLSLHNEAIIIDCHSFRNKPFGRDLNKETPRPDFFIGTDDFHTPRSLYKLSAVILKALGYRVKVNTPYSGSIIPMRHYLKDKRVISLMIEVNRDLYLASGSNEKNERYKVVKSDIHKLLTTISKNHYDTNKVLPLIQNDDM